MCSHVFSCVYGRHQMLLVLRACAGVHVCPGVRRCARAACTGVHVFLRACVRRCARVRCAPACMCSGAHVRVRVRRRACARRCARVRARAFSSSPRARNASERADNCATSPGLGKTEEGCPVLLEGLALQRLGEDVRGVVGRLDVNGLDEAVAHEVADVQVPCLDVLGRCVGHRVV